MNEILATTAGSYFAQTTQEQLHNVNLNSPTLLNLISGTGNSISTDDRDRISTLLDNVLQYSDSVDYNPTIDLYILSYDVNKKLIAAPDLIAQNLKNYLNKFRM